MQKKTEILHLVLTVLFFLLLALNSSRFFLRIDLTTNRIFSLSEVSKNLYREIPENVYITYYVSKKLKAVSPIPAQIEDLLYELVAHSKGKIRVDITDPVLDREERRALELGIVPQKVEIIEGDALRVAEMYTGIAIHYLDRSEALPVAFQIETLEYDLAYRIRRLVRGEKAIIGLLLGDFSLDFDRHFRSLESTLASRYALRRIGPGEAIPEEVNVLFVFGNRHLREPDLLPVDKFLMRGGRALFAVEGVTIDFQRELEAKAVGESPLLKMLEHYGVVVEQALVLDRYCQNFRLPRQVSGQVMWEILGPYPYWIALSSQYAAADNPMTANFPGLDLFWASPIAVETKAGLETEILLTTTDRGWVLDRPPFATLPEQAERLIDSQPFNPGRIPLAVTVSGELSSYFHDKLPPNQGAVPGQLNSFPGGGRPTRVIVIGDADFATEFLHYTDGSYNLHFLQNAADWLNNEEDLLSIRTRATRDVRLNKIRDQEVRDRTIKLTRLSNLILIPFVVAGFGALRLAGRRRKSRYSSSGRGRKQ
ncbi:MAG: GldG family protein [Spirochaetaceae bacterium]|nr:MAG: GldG family protein [Spirochaetaceae bacterium]